MPVSAAITASWEALDEGARTVLATLGIFAGELSADAAEAIVAREAAMAQAIRSGTPIGDVMGGAYEHMLKT